MQWRHASSSPWRPLHRVSSDESGERVTIDVTEAAPQKVFELLAHELDCKITVDRAVKKPLTVRLADKPASDIIVTICQSIECEWRFDGKNLLIKPLSAGMRSHAASMKAFSQSKEVTVTDTESVGNRFPFQAGRARPEFLKFVLPEFLAFRARGCPRLRVQRSSVDNVTGLGSPGRGWRTTRCAGNSGLVNTECGFSC